MSFKLLQMTEWTNTLHTFSVNGWTTTVLPPYHGATGIVFIVHFVRKIMCGQNIALQFMHTDEVMQMSDKAG